MKKIALCFLIVIQILTAHISFAQNGMFAGKIVDENNKPVAGAIIKVSRPDMQPIEIISDSDGVYCTRYVTDGNYYLDVFADGKYRGESQLLIDTASGAKKFFLIKVHSRKFAINSFDKDPEMAIKLRKAQDACMPIPAADIKGGTYMYMLKVDTSKAVDSVPITAPVPHKKTTRR